MPEKKWRWIFEYRVFAERRVALRRRMMRPRPRRWKLLHHVKGPGLLRRVAMDVVETLASMLWMRVQALEILRAQRMERSTQTEP